MLYPDNVTITTMCDKLASRFHEAYERQAPLHGYPTDSASAPWPEMPDRYRALMNAVAGEVVGPLIVALEQLIVHAEDDLGPTPASDDPLTQAARTGRRILRELSEA